jgi:hypothetical protein
MGAYNGFFRRNHRRITAVSESATSLSLNPSVISIGKIAWRHHAVAYIPDELYTPSAKPSVYTDSIIPLLFSDFLVVGRYEKKKTEKKEKGRKSNEKESWQWHYRK